ncbi:hypothetical protein APS67_002690 [Streptomyces sp. AVP053U2]|nr:hypothetical protein APS67_002690 [Streptomyces sp. AVP053U2]
MPTLPWTVPNTLPPHTEVHVFASRFETRTLRGALRFFLGTPGVWRQVSRAPGAYGASLKAQPLRQTFWTVSAWESPKALGAFARTARTRRPPAGSPRRCATPSSPAGPRRARTSPSTGPKYSAASPEERPARAPRTRTPPPPARPAGALVLSPCRNSTTLPSPR